MAKDDGGATLIGCDRVPSATSSGVRQPKAQKRSRAEQTENGQQRPVAAERR